ncbi:growth-regulating factor 3-like [Cucurbita pepo subsp. pepo]|uniref:growth-regulating factor 3-like n=1 Tax=Cucurbita pepo subsp. pepo TaxID=3664 RepID=UPI000C9D8439|nr:growth-regulating factor 3-like [Cucurbita pepo subsp. pepo]
MDFDLKKCRRQAESEEEEVVEEPQHSAKICKFFVEQPHRLQQQQQQQPSSCSSVLPLFVPGSINDSKASNMLSAFPDSTSSSSSSHRLPRMLGYFSVAQRHELELQALIFRYMLAGAAVPPELLHPIKKSLLSSTAPFFLHHPLQHFPHYPTLLQAGYWGRAAMDPEPGRCRRTDGKKWRCSRDVVAGQKYCERHMHRGRNRSRKPVETTTTKPTSTTTTAAAAAAVSSGGCSLCSNANRVVGGGGGRPFLTVESGNYSCVCGQTPSVDLLHLNQGASSDSLSENKNFYESHKEGSAGDGKSDGHILRHFFDDWPRSENGGCGSDNSNASQRMNPTSLSISVAGNPPSSSSDVSLKLSTGGGSDQGSGDPHLHQNGNIDGEHMHLNWAAGWAATQMASMGGPLAEALRSANKNSLPTTVLHQLQRTTNSEATFIST